MSYAYIPNLACSKLPVCLKLSMTLFTTFIGIANPIPSADDIFTVFIPMTSPDGVINGPPLFPGFIVASVCIRSDMYVFSSPSSNFMLLFLALIIPDVTVLLNSNPIGFPIAYTVSPTLILSESPSGKYVKFFASIFVNDKSTLLSLHTTVPVYFFPSSSVI